ncbi:DMT family transporter [Bacillus sp. EB01]|uniref:DMT family transporter n=1 Tax=Bacillus sp. EB01 TaxID=1347086 RepID=UPI0005C52D16|nr:DMT family transporter [Bacillus sp. EB01]
MNTKDIGVLFALAALFGSSFLFVRIASPVIGPYLTSQGRVSFGAMALLILVFIIGKPTHFKQRWKQYLIIGALNSAIPFTLVSLASLHLNASLLAIINSMTPFFTALVAWAWMKEQLTPKKLIGIFLGIIGVTITVGWSPVQLTFDVIIASLCSLFSTVAYGFGGVYAKKTFRNSTPLPIAFGQLVGATLLLFPLTAATLPDTFPAISPVVASSLIGLGVFSTALGYLLYYYLIASVGPTKTVTVTFLIPLFGMVWGVIFLKEQITSGMIVGLFIILSSLFLISDIEAFRKKT